MSIWRRYGYAWITLAFFLFSLAGHWVFAWFAYADEQRAHGRPIEVSGYLTQTARDTLENCNDWDEPVYAAWARRLSEALDRCREPVLLIGHSLGTSLVMRWAHTAKTHTVAGAFLVAPTDRDRFEKDPARGFGPMLLRPLPFPSMVLASRNDERVSFERAQAFATAWGSRLVDVGPQGHIGSAAKLGLWPQGLVWLGQFIASLPPHAKCRSEPSLDEAPADE